MRVIDEIKDYYDITDIKILQSVDEVVNEFNSWIYDEEDIPVDD